MAGPSHLLSVLQLIHQGKMAAGQGVGFAELSWLLFTGWPALSREGERNSLPPPILRVLISDVSAFWLSVAGSKEGGAGWVHGHPASALYPRQVRLETAFSRNFCVTAAAGQLLQRWLYFSEQGNHTCAGLWGEKPWGNPSGWASAGQLPWPPRAAAIAPGPTGQHRHQAHVRGAGDAGTTVTPVVINNNFMWPSVIRGRCCP